MKHIQNPVKYDGEYYLESCVALAYLEPWHTQNPRHIQNDVKHLSWNMLFKSLYNLAKFRTLIYSLQWYILKSNHIQDPVEYLRRILLRTLCNYRKFRSLIYPKLLHIQNLSVSLMYQLFFRSKNLLLLLYISTSLY